MEVGLFSIGVARTADPDIIGQIARTADDMGFASLWAPEHMVLFTQDAYTSRYPYNESGKIGISDVDLLDPFTALAFAAAHTSRIKLATGICLVPQRHPSLPPSSSPAWTGSRKAGCSLVLALAGSERNCERWGFLRSVARSARVNTSRLCACCGPRMHHPFRESFAPFRRCNRFPNRSRAARIPRSSSGAIRRQPCAGLPEVGDGWLGFHLSPEEVAPLVQRLYQYAVEAGRHGDERFIGVVAPGQVTPEGLQQYRDAGVRHLVVRLPTVAPERLETALGELRERLVVPAQAL